MCEHTHSLWVEVVQREGQIFLSKKNRFIYFLVAVCKKMLREILKHCD